MRSPSKLISLVAVCSLPLLQFFQQFTQYKDPSGDVSFVQQQVQQIGDSLATTVGSAQQQPLWKEWFLNQEKEEDDDDEEDDNLLQSRLQRNYFFQLLSQFQNGKYNNNTEQLYQLLPPIEVMSTYIQQHSKQQLQKEWKDCLQRRNNGRNNTLTDTNSTNTTSFDCPSLASRRYIVATYTCPLESGNRLHRFMNGLLWGILTNRTFLARYHTTEVCYEYFENVDEKGATLSTSCEERYGSKPPYLHGYKSDCNHILHLSNWIPSYDELWNQRLQNLDINTTIVSAQIGGKRGDDPITIPYDSIANPVLLRPGMFQQLKPNPGAILSAEPVNHTQYLSRPTNLQRLSKLKSFGIYFTYGLLFESLFTLDKSLYLRDDVKNEILTTKNAHKTRSTIQTYVIHSRRKC